MKDFTDYLKTLDKKDLVIVLLLIVGLALGVYTVQNPQVFQSQAQGNLYNAFDIKDSSGNKVNCTDSFCATRSLDVDVQLKDLAPLQSAGN